MHNNVLNELILVEQYYNEYLQLIHKYQNISRQSIFCKYYNINKSFSTFGVETESTYDSYNSGINYDLFEYTPLFYASQIVNDSQDQQDLMGQMFLGNLNVIIYTVSEPSINDLITFPYVPNTASEIFKVTNIRTPINAKTSIQKLNWYELTLETAPIKDINKLKIVNRFVYALTLQKYIYYDEFQRMLKELTKLEEFIKIINTKFDSYTELFYYIDPITNQKIAPLEENSILSDFLRTVTGYFREFNTSYRPFGIDKYGLTGNIDINTKTKVEYVYHGGQLYDGGYDSILNKVLVIQPANVKLNILEYNGEINIFTIVKLLNSWIWRNSIPFKSQYVEYVDDKFIHCGYDDTLENAEYDPNVICIETE